MLKGDQQPGLYGLAEQLVDNPGQLEVYDHAKWNLLGHADREQRFQGHHPWLKKRDSRGVERTMSVPVFSGYSEDKQTVMVVRKDPWTHQNDPESWLVVEQNLLTGDYAAPKILSANIDAGRRMWLQLAPRNYDNWPPGYHPALYARPYDQLRITGQLDRMYHLQSAEYHAGLGGERVAYEDIEALESMIVAVQQLRWAEAERAYQEVRAQMMAEELGARGVMTLETLRLVS
jgi:hypothetical protein